MLKVSFYGREAVRGHKQEAAAARRCANLAARGQRRDGAQSQLAEEIFLVHGLASHWRHGRPPFGEAARRHGGAAAGQRRRVQNTARRLKVRTYGSLCVLID
ncbi:hypothetical protein [Paraburkholderia bannensis]|uniref:hypothetical protein n=1 Tax=Paraburkholderia bannensis TaxID=765414 RepID=UPI0004892040|nr:hypothetical protein [Paraburkholderia bannensis]